MQSLSTSHNDPNWQQTTYGDAKLAWSREGQTGKPFLHIIRNGVREFEESMGHQFPRQLFITHQHMWWGTSTNHNTTSSSVSPQKVAYVELPEEDFAGESCRVFQAPGRSERLWISRATGRLRGALHYIHQGYFTPFYKQDVVTKLVGRRVESHDEYNKLFSESGTFAKEVQLQLSQAWAEHEFSRAYPGDLIVLDDFREIATGKWFPFKVKTANWLHNEKNQGKYDFNVSESVVTGVAIDRNDLEPYWSEFLPKTGDKVSDQRYNVAVDYQFDKDRTEEEIQTLVNDQLLLSARSAVQIEKAQSPFTNMIGKPTQSPKASGSILAIDAMNGLAVISLGESDSIQAKQLLDVVRDGKSIAQLRVITLHKNRCVGKTIDEIEQPTLKTGDKVLSFDTTLSP